MDATMIVSFSSDSHTPSDRVFLDPECTKEQPTISHSTQIPQNPVHFVDPFQWDLRMPLFPDFYLNVLRYQLFRLENGSEVVYYIVAVQTTNTKAALYISSEDFIKIHEKVCSHYLCASLFPLHTKIGLSNAPKKNYLS